MEKQQLINFISKVMEESGFKVYKNFKTSIDVIDIYAILPTTVGDFGVVVACNDYDKNFPVGVDLLKNMESIAENIEASKVMIVTSSFFSEQATNYALRKNIKLVDRSGLLELAHKYQNHEEEVEVEIIENYHDDDKDYVRSNIIEDDYAEYDYDARDMEYLMRNNGNVIYSGQNNLYRQMEYDQSNENMFSKFKRKNNNGALNSININKVPIRSILAFIKPYLGNPVVLVILVVLISYFISYLIGNILKSSSAIGGIVELFFALALSYGFTYFFAQRNRYFIIRGTFVFFVSLIILIILILI